MKLQKYLSALLALGFYLGLYQGRVALYSQGCDTPVTVYPYSAALLPISDRQALEKGIPCPNQEELNRLLENYLS